jgi:hypothetical protein
MSRDMPTPHRQHAHPPSRAAIAAPHTPAFPCCNRRVLHVAMQTRDLLRLRFCSTEWGKGPVFSVPGSTEQMSRVCVAASRTLHRRHGKAGGDKTFNPHIGIRRTSRTHPRYSRLGKALLSEGARSVRQDQRRLRRQKTLPFSSLTAKAHHTTPALRRSANAPAVRPSRPPKTPSVCSPSTGGA